MPSFVKVKEPYLIPFKTEHLKEIGGEITMARFRAEKFGPAFTAMMDERPIGAAGIIILWPGVGEAWSVLSEDIRRYPKWLLRNCRNVLWDSVASLNLHRVQASCKDIYRDGHFLEKLGFNDSLLLKRFGQDKRDHYLYSLVR